MAVIKRKGRSVTTLEVSLPTEKSIPLNEIGGFASLIYGRKKIGKTSFCSWFEKAFFLMTEPGAKKLSIFQRAVPDWRHFKAYVVKITGEKNQFETIVIDTVDWLYEICLRHVCTKLMIQHPADLEYGKGWDAVKKEFNAEINKLLNSGKGVIFISHMKEEEIEERSGKKYHRRTNTLSGQAKACVEGLVDIWACYDYDGKKRILTIMGDDFTDAGHRLNEPPDQNFLYTNGEPVREINMGKTSKEAHDNFMRGFNNKLVKEGGSTVVQKKGLKLKIKK